MTELTERERGVRSRSPDPQQEADLLLALVTGLSDAVLLGHRTLAETTERVDHHLGRLTP